MREQDLKNWYEHFEWRYVWESHAPCRVLDFGCGYGYGDIHLVRNGFEVWGYDPSKERLNVAEYLYEKESEAVKSKLHFSNSLPNATVDLIWICHVLEHCPKSEWTEIFDKLNAYNCPILVSVPQGHHYDMSEHINHWELPENLNEWLFYHSGRPWKVWEVKDFAVLRAVTI